MSLALKFKELVCEDTPDRMDELLALIDEIDTDCDIAFLDESSFALRFSDGSGVLIQVPGTVH